MHKTLVSLLTVGLLVAAVGGAAAYYRPSRPSMPEITANVAFVDSTTTSAADSGVMAENIATVDRADAFGVDLTNLNTIRTGNANASAYSYNRINSNPCTRCNDSDLTLNMAMVKTQTHAQAWTGAELYNTARISHADADWADLYNSNTVTTGHADSSARSLNVVNSSYSYGN